MVQRAISLLREGLERSEISSCVTGSVNTADDPRLLHIPGGVFFLFFSNDHVRGGGLCRVTRMLGCAHDTSLKQV